jgi:hypothetical protein
LRDGFKTGYRPQEAWVMRLPRIRFTVGTFLLMVAFVAVNFLTLKRVNDTDLYSGGKYYSYRLLPFDIGILPLFDVTLVSVWLFAAKHLRSLQRGCAEHTRSSLSGVAYFSFHFLSFVGLIALFAPDVQQQIESLLDQITRSVAERWGAAFGEPGGSVPWIIAESLILGTAISGPFLLLSWMGQVLAIRCASKLPRARFLALAGLVELGLLGVALAICLTVQPFETVRNVSLDIQVIDEISGQPVPSAFAWITDPFSDCASELFIGESPAPFPKALTDNDGKARLTGRFIVRGEYNAFQAWGRPLLWGRWLEVSAVGHRSLRIPLTDAVNVSAEPMSPSLRAISLARGNPRNESFRDITGIYVSGGHGFGLSWLRIEPDGRFALCVSGCMPPDFHEYGYLKRHGEEIELVSVPNPGRGIDTLMMSRYRTIEWGDRLYFSLADEKALGEFCREALTPNRTSKSDEMSGSLLRITNSSRPREGMPRLPAKVWLKFLIGEMNDHLSLAHHEHQENSITQ